MEPITFDELLTELGYDPAIEDGWYTAREYSDKWGVAQTKARNTLKLAQQAGRLAVRQGTRVALDGRLGKVPIYQITPKEPKSKRKK